MEKTKIPTNLRQSCRTICELADRTTTYLNGWEKASIVLITNMCTLWLTLPPGKRANSNIIISPKASGKGTFLCSIIKKGNEDDILLMHDKAFESELCTRGEDVYNYKILINEDLAIFFNGMSVKQREQLIGFFQAILSSGNYERKNIEGQPPFVLHGVWCIVMFGLAKEYWSKFQKKFFDVTLLERIVPIYPNITEEDYDKTCECMTDDLVNGKCSREIPIIELPIPDQSKLILIPANLKKRVQQIGKRFSLLTGMGRPRALTYISNFIMANAMINGRDSVIPDDIEMFEYVEDIHYPIDSNNPTLTVYYHIARSENGLSIQELSDITELSEKTVRMAKDELLKKGQVKLRTEAHNKQILEVK